MRYTVKSSSPKMSSKCSSPTPWWVLWNGHHLSWIYVSQCIFKNQSHFFIVTHVGLKLSLVQYLLSSNCTKLSNSTGDTQRKRDPDSAQSRGENKRVNSFKKRDISMIVWKFKGGEPTTWLGKMIEVVNQIRKENIYWTLTLGCMKN